MFIKAVETVSIIIRGKVVNFLNTEAGLHPADSYFVAELIELLQLQRIRLAQERRHFCKYAV